MAATTIIPYNATHPGTLLKDELVARKISQKDLAVELGVPPTFLNEIIKGKRSITADFAILLEKSLNISAEYWMRFQSQYDIDKANIKAKNVKKIQLIGYWNIIKGLIPVKEISRLGYFKDDLEYNIARINLIYNITSIEELLNVVAVNESNAYFRKSEKLQYEPKNILAWSKIAKFEADNTSITDFKPEAIEELLVKLRLLFFENKNVTLQAQKLLAEYGIKLIYLDKFEKTPIDGYSFWSINNPAIALTLRYKRIDNFAFTLMHEIGHILLHIQKNRDLSFIDNNESKNEDEAELQADLFAQEVLISKEQWNEFKSSLRSWNDQYYIAFGNKYKINPAILLGRASFESSFYAVKSQIERKLN